MIEQIFLLGNPRGSQKCVHAHVRMILRFFLTGGIIALLYTLVLTIYIYTLCAAIYVNLVAFNLNRQQRNRCQISRENL